MLLFWFWLSCLILRGQGCFYFILFYFLLIRYCLYETSGARFRTMKISTSIRLVPNAEVSSKAFMSSSAATETSTGSESSKAYGSEQIQASNWEFQILSQFLHLMFYSLGWLSLLR